MASVSEGTRLHGRANGAAVAVTPGGSLTKILLAVDQLGLIGLPPGPRLTCLHILL